MGAMEDKASISFLFTEIITCGAVLSGFELCEALRELGHECNIVTKHRNEELESYFGITPIEEPKGTTITFSPRLAGDYAYIRTKDARWETHREPKIAVSRAIHEWIGADTIIGNGTHRRFYNMRLGEDNADLRWEHIAPNLVYTRDIDILIEGNYEPNKNIEETIKKAKEKGGKIVWFGRHTIPIEGVECISHPPLDCIPQLYNRAKTLLKMSKHEGWGRPIAEAKACGCKVINKSGGNKDIEITSWQDIAKQLIKYIHETNERLSNS